MKVSPATQRIKLPSGKHIAFAIIAGIFPLTTLGVVLFCTFLLSDSGKSALSKPNLKKGVYTFFAASPPVLGTMSERYVSSDAKAEIINQYFAIQKAPLAGYGDVFIKAAEENNIPWTLVPSIAMQESNAGKKIPEGTFNAWGWGITESETLGFNSWEEGINTVSKGLRKYYFDQGLATPQEIMTKYCPISLTKGGAWAKGVEYFQLELASF